MQEKFVLKTLKKVAAIGTGVAMAGATLTGALALDLAEYPSPYVVDGTYDDSTALVVGDNALAADTLGVSDIVANLQFEAKTAVTSDASTTVSVEGGKTEKIPLAMELAASTFFDTSLQDDDVSNFFDGEISFQGKSYDTSEELHFYTGGPLVTFSLNSTEDDYTSGVYMEVPLRDSIKFYYKFDESINISTASTSQPLEIELLGDDIRITDINTGGTKFTAYVGEEHYLLVDESVTVDVDGVSKTVGLDEAGSTSAVVNVDGTTEIINTGATQIVNGVEITVDSTFSRTERTESSAVLVVGKDSSETYQDGDPYIGEPTDGSAEWVWDLAGLRTTASSDYTNSYLVFGIENDFITNDLDDAPAGVGECVALPNDYAKICYDSMTVATEDYATYTFEIDKDLDVSKTFNSSLTSVDALYIKTDASDGMEMVALTDAIGTYGNETSNKKAKEVWLYYGNGASLNGSTGGVGTHMLDILYKDPSDTSTVRWFGAVNSSGAADVLRINYGNTKDTNLVLEANGTASATQLALFFDVTPDNTAEMAVTDDLYLRWGVSSDAIASLGTTASSEEASEVSWQQTGAAGSVNIGTKDEDHRTAYGIIVKDPKSQGASDSVELSIPQDQVFANVVVQGTTTTVSGGSTSYVPAAITPATHVASEISAPADYQLILVGGPCANDLVEDLFDMTCAGWSFESGEAVLKLADNGNNVAMLVAGTSADDTRRAAKVVANYADYALSGTEALVTGTSFTDIEVGAVEMEAEAEEEEVVEEEAAEE